MNWNGRLRMVCTPVVGATIVAGAVGAALLAGPMIGAQAAQWPENYYNGGFCYQNPKGQGNASRLQFAEIAYGPEYRTAVFSRQPQKWDAESNQYHDDGNPLVGQVNVDKRMLVTNGSYSDSNEFCKHLTRDLNDAHPYGEWTSRREPTASPAASPSPARPRAFTSLPLETAGGEHQGQVDPSAVTRSRWPAEHQA